MLIFPAELSEKRVPVRTIERPNKPLFCLTWFFDFANIKIMLSDTQIKLIAEMNVLEGIKFFYLVGAILLLAVAILVYPTLRGKRK